MRKYVLDTNLYIEADRNREEAEQLVQFYSAFLPFTYLHSVVALELLAGAVDNRRARQIQESYIAPFDARGRLVTPSHETWKRAGDVIAALLRENGASKEGVSRSFVQDVLLAMSCREHGLVLVTRNQRDFARIRQIARFDFVLPWPT